MDGGEATAAVEGGAEPGSADADAAMDGEIDVEAEVSPKLATIAAPAVVVEDPEDNIDFSQDERMSLMIAHIEEHLDKFKAEDHWKQDHYHWLQEFL